MRTIQRIAFVESVLIPAKSVFKASPLLSYYLARISGISEDRETTAHIIIFNCENVKDIPSMVALEIKGIEESIEKDSEHKDESLSQMNFFSNLKKEIENPLLRHNPPEELLNFISIFGLNGITKEKVIFLSGVTSLVEA